MFQIGNPKESEMTLKEFDQFSKKKKNKPLFKPPPQIHHRISEIKTVNPYVLR